MRLKSLFRRKFAQGGGLPAGPGRSNDSIPARLSPGSAFVSDDLRDRIGDDGVRQIGGLGEDAEIYSPRDWPNVP